MGIVELLLTAIGLSMDAFAVSVCKGLGMRKMRYDQALVIGLYFGVFQALMPLLGWLLGTSFSRYIQAFDHWIAFVLLAFIGGKMLWDVFREKEESAAEKSDARLDHKELFMLAIATSIDALAVGIAFACLDVQIWSSVSIIGCVTLVLPQTMIDYPLMGGTDSDRYTDHNYEGGYDLYGTPFLDSRNAVDFSDFFSLVFGHNMNNSAMFGSLDDFLQESAFADLSDGVLLLPDERYRLEVTASIAATCPAQELIDQIMTADAAEQPQLLEQLLEMAAVKKDDVTVSEEDHWVMLSTLDYADEKNDNGTPSMLLLKLRTSTT